MLTNDVCNYITNNVLLSNKLHESTVCIKETSFSDNTFTTEEYWCTNTLAYFPNVYLRYNKYYHIVTHCLQTMYVLMYSKFYLCKLGDMPDKMAVTEDDV